eukprot:TRINITY_DN16113_c0_g1_i1.p1 TRINITY_DN16113_c0_g1~~TRINITY_DN16113_c0_g1_i1.p1  ORF type:complete len:569 (+),score=135.42 TRINITY_DN16113_c0_g1_i1:42-1709(+)
MSPASPRGSPRGRHRKTGVPEPRPVHPGPAEQSPAAPVLPDPPPLQPHLRMQVLAAEEAERECLQEEWAEGVARLLPEADVQVRWQKVRRKLVEAARIQPGDTDTVDAFIALGGRPNLSGDIATELVRNNINSFDLKIDIDRMLSEADTDKSGFIDFGEFKNMFAEQEVGAEAPPAMLHPDYVDPADLPEFLRFPRTVRRPTHEPDASTVAEDGPTLSRRRPRRGRKGRRPRASGVLPAATDFSKRRRQLLGISVDASVHAHKPQLARRVKPDQFSILLPPTLSMQTTAARLPGSMVSPMRDRERCSQDDRASSVRSRTGSAPRARVLSGFGKRRVSIEDPASSGTGSRIGRLPSPVLSPADSFQGPLDRLPQNLALGSVVAVIGRGSPLAPEESPCPPPPADPPRPKPVADDPLCLHLRTKRRRCRAKRTEANRLFNRVHDGVLERIPLGFGIVPPNPVAATTLPQLPVDPPRGFGMPVFQVSSVPQWCGRLREPKQSPPLPDDDDWSPEDELRTAKVLARRLREPAEKESLQLLRRRRPSRRPPMLRRSGWGM